MKTINDVIEFRGFSVINGEVRLTSCDYEDYLNETYEPITVCGMLYDAGNSLRVLDPTAFRCGKSDYESALQDELIEALENEDYNAIEFEE